jgi:hypothetical protein
VVEDVEDDDEYGNEEVEDYYEENDDYDEDVEVEESKESERSQWEGNEQTRDHTVVYDSPLNEKFTWSQAK